MRRLSFFLFTACVTILASCSGRTGRLAGEGGDTLRLRYAERLSIVDCGDYTVATIANPWKPGQTLHTYVLVPSGRELPADLPEGTVIRTPLRRSVIFTTVHCALLQMLHREECIAGVADLKYIKLPYVQEGVRSGRITDCGDGMNPVIEKIIDLHPDAIFLSPFENSGGYGRLEEIGIPLVECAEYMETSPLGRAEWMRFYGLLFGEQAQADSLFAVVEDSYQLLCRQAKASQAAAPSVLVDKMAGSVWYVPGGQSTIGQMLRDAGCRYAWADDERSGSIALSFETVLERAGDADVWLFRYDSDRPITYAQLLAEHAGYAQLQPFSHRRVYGCNVRTSQFYEQSPFRPDWLLADFIRILRPDIRNLPEPRYYKKIED